MTAPSVVIIGAGIAGLTCAIELARRGVNVTVLERGDAPGGKMRESVAGSRLLDAGPTVLTMRWVFDEIFDSAGTSLGDHVDLTQADILARHLWSGSERLDLFSDPVRSADAIAAFAGADEGRGYLAFCAEARGVYETLRDTFLVAPQTGPLGLARRVGLQHARALTEIRPFETLWRSLERHFKDPRLRQLFARYATYCGSSPFAAPATLMLIAHVEREGVWLIGGGMQRLAEALASLAKSLGATVRYGAQVDEIVVRSGRPIGVRLADGEHVCSSVVVVNADSAAVADGAFGVGAAWASRTIPVAERSLSAVVWTLQARTHGFPLARHNVFFSSDYQAEFAALFTQRRLAQAPTVYVCAQDRSDAHQSPEEPEGLLLLVNAPADGDRRPLDVKELATCQIRMFEQLRRCGLDVSMEPGTQSVTTPETFHRLFPATGGALYGRATHGWRAAFARPGARTKMPGLYQAGGGAHPGAGVPMAALSGRLAASQLLADQISRHWSIQEGTFGGIWTRSAKTAAMG